VRLKSTRIHTDAVSVTVVPIRTNFDIVQSFKPKNEIIERVLLQAVDRLVKIDEGNDWRIYETRLGTFTTKTKRQEILAKGLFRERPFLLQLNLLLHLFFTQDNGFHDLVIFSSPSLRYMNAWAIHYPLSHLTLRPAFVFRRVVVAQICQVIPISMERQEGMELPLKHLVHGFRHQSNELTLESTGQATGREKNVTRSMQQ